MSGYLTEHKDELSPYILIDAGNFTGKNTPQGRLKTEAVLRSFKVMKYDSVAYLTKEKEFSRDLFPSIIEGNEIPAVSDTHPGNKSLLINRDGFNVNISIDPESYLDSMLNVLLTDRPVSEAGLIKGWDVIISSSGEILDEPVKVNEAVILSGYPGGEKLGILTVMAADNGEIKFIGHRWQSLGSDVKEDSKIRDIMNDYDSKVAKLLKESEKPPAGDTYVGAAKCAECHQLYEESWKKTRHASAFESLQQAGKSNDPECIVCHTVGFGEKGGFYSIDTTPELANVQCEECHGLDREHIEDYSRPMKRVTVDVCLKCHTRDNSPDFDYPVYLKKIIH